jgi:hypothetical protein
MNTDNIPDKIKDQLDIRLDLFGNEFVSDTRPVAGKSAAKSGKIFEDITEAILCGKGCTIIKRPKFKCHFGLDRQGDFKIVTSERTIHVECKQLGNVESHFDKLSHVFYNLIRGCYGKEMWLVYDYNSNVNMGGHMKIEALIKECIDIKKQVALQGITFELVLIDDLKEKMMDFFK